MANEEGTSLKVAIRQIYGHVRNRDAAATILGGFPILCPQIFRIYGPPPTLSRTEFTQPRSFCLLFGNPLPPPTVDVINGSPLTQMLSNLVICDQ